MTRPRCNTDRSEMTGKWSENEFASKYSYIIRYMKIWNNTLVNILKYEYGHANVQQSIELLLFLKCTWNGRRSGFRCFHQVSFVAHYSYTGKCIKTLWHPPRCLYVFTGKFFHLTENFLPARMQLTWQKKTINNNHQQKCCSKEFNFYPSIDRKAF